MMTPADGLDRPTHPIPLTYGAITRTVMSLLVLSGVYTATHPEMNLPPVLYFLGLVLFVIAIWAFVKGRGFVRRSKAKAKTASSN
jgi:protein-S-isoprenylcysteine O-methyltransferase Ste14